jgi:hypothetical protein
MTPRELEQTIRSLMQRPMADTELRGELEKLAAAEISFSGFTWLDCLSELPLLVTSRWTQPCHRRVFPRYGKLR